MKESMMRVFEAGATGAIGKQLVPRLVGAGHKVNGLTRSESRQAIAGDLHEALWATNAAHSASRRSPAIACLDSLRVRPLTLCPAPTRRGTNCLPIAPVAPASNTLIIDSFIEDY